MSLHTTQNVFSVLYACWSLKDGFECLYFERWAGVKWDAEYISFAFLFGPSPGNPRVESKMIIKWYEYMYKVDNDGDESIEFAVGLKDEESTLKEMYIFVYLD
jgi:hypothetical protein